jgi:DNA polymerase III gamma/tau subunit
MHSFLITGSSAEKRIDEAKSRAATLSSGFDLIIVENPKGIDSAREIKSSLTRKPYQSKAISIILEEAQTLTVEAQNALLKTLEEPPGTAQVYLTAPTVDPFLPTVLSRVHVSNLGPLKKDFDEETVKKAWTLWHERRLSKLFDATDIGPEIWAALARALLFYKLGITEKEVGPVIGEPELKKSANDMSTEKIKLFLQACQHTSELLNHNVNRKLAMENLIIKLPNLSKSHETAVNTDSS